MNNCIVRADGYGSVLEHVLSDFVNIVTLNHDIGTLFVHDLPRKVIDSLRSSYGNVVLFLDRVPKKKLYAVKTAEGVTFVHCIGIRKTSIQKSIEYLEESIKRLRSKEIYLCTTQ